MPAVVKMAAIAVTGGMKKVMGTSIAVAIVADKPGTQPTNRPNAAQEKITNNVEVLKINGIAAPKLSSIT